MKKILLWTLAVLTLAPAQAQFSLRKNGQAIFGKRMNKTLIVNPTGQNTPQSVLSDNPMLVPIDTLFFSGNIQGIRELTSPSEGTSICGSAKRRAQAQVYTAPMFWNLASGTEYPASARAAWCSVSRPLLPAPVPSLFIQI